MLTTKILIVKNNMEQNMALASYFRSLGYKDYSALTAHEGVVIFTIHRPHIIIVDNELPDASSYKLIREFRKNPDCRIIMISEDTSFNAFNNAYTSGADHFFPAPLNIEHLKYKVQSLESRLMENISIVTIGDIHLNIKDMTISTNEGTEQLKTMEFKVMKILVDYLKENIIISKEELEILLYGKPMKSTVISVYLVRLRDKIKKIHSTNVEIDTLYGKGYRLSIKNNLSHLL